MTKFENRVKRVELLTSEEVESLKQFVKNEGTLIDAAAKIGIGRVTLSYVIFKGSGSPDTCSKIRKVLNPDL